jgi:hypothetical protein
LARRRVRAARKSGTKLTVTAPPKLESVAVRKVWDSVGLTGKAAESLKSLFLAWLPNELVAGVGVPLQGG